MKHVLHLDTGHEVWSFAFQIGLDSCGLPESLHLVLNRIAEADSWRSPSSQIFNRTPGICQRLPGLSHRSQYNLMGSGCAASAKMCIYRL
ncbi:hypothetical protein D3C72_965930 [compost metagenome]